MMRHAWLEAALNWSTSRQEPTENRLNGRSLLSTSPPTNKRRAAYPFDIAGRPEKKLGSYDGKIFRIELTEARSIALGPDIKELKSQKFIEAIF